MKGKTLLRTHECKDLHMWAEDFAGGLGGVEGAEDQAGEFDGVVDRRNDLRGVLDRFAAEADRRGQGCGDKQCALEAVVRVRRLGHEAAIVRCSPFVRLYRGGATQKGLPLPTLAGSLPPFPKLFRLRPIGGREPCGCAAGVGLLDLL